MRSFILGLCLATAAGAVRADDLLGSYFVELGPQDFYNSSGARLTTGGAIFQQDRANFHRFGIRHGGDSADAYFATPQARAMIPQLLARGSNPAFVRDIAALDPATAARKGFADYLVVICGTGGRLSKLVLNHADGDHHNGC